MKVYVVNFGHEYHEGYPPLVVAEKPTDAQLRAYCRQEFPREFGENSEGSGDWGTALIVEVVEHPVQDINKLLKLKKTPKTKGIWIKTKKSR